MPIELITRTSKEYYEEKFMLEGKQLFSALFPRVDSSLEEAFLLDKLIQVPHGITYRNADTQSHLREYTPGTGMLITIPRASEKTPLSEKLLAAVAVGMDATSGFGENEVKIINDISDDHISGHNMTKNKQAIEVLELGEFHARGPGGADLDLDITFPRHASLSITYDFTQTGATFSEAVANLFKACKARGIPLANLGILCGENWLAEYSKDATAQNNAQNNAQNTIIVNPMTPKPVEGVDGLFAVGQIRTVDMLAPVWILSYSPDVLYKAHATASEEPFLNPNKCIMLSFVDRRYNVQRGISVRDESGTKKRVSGELVIDKFESVDPDTTFLRSATRHTFVPANMNHTGVSLGTFS